jgi:DNA-binding NarL/FixJ family response regulator
MLKMQSDALCPGQDLRNDYCPAIKAVEESIIKDRPRLNRILTPTEAQVAEYTKQGHSIKHIAGQMNISERTVKNHRHAIRKKLNIAHTNINLTKYLQTFPA